MYASSILNSFFFLLLSDAALLATYILPIFLLAYSFIIHEYTRNEHVIFCFYTLPAYL